MKKLLLITTLIAGPLACPAQEAGSSRFVLRSCEVAAGGILPVDFTGDGSGSTLPLAWDGGPKGTASYAVIMHHMDPEGIGTGAGAGSPPPRAGEDGGGTTGGLRKPWLQQHGAELDANKDGVVTWAEITDDMNRAFAIYDRNSDGDLAAGELKATGDVREGAAFAGLIYRHFKDLDTNGDGNVSRDEMAAAVKYNFDSADLDRDGKLTSAEWQSAPGTPLPIPKNSH